jgi:anti-repressor protein
MNAPQQAAQSQPSTDLVIVRGNDLVATTLAIAAGTANTHEAVVKLVRTHQQDFEEFGLVRFEIEPRKPGQHGGGDTEYALLNEDQATLLITYMRNNVIVRKFKVALVREFSNMRKQLAAAVSTRAIPDFMNPATAARAWADEVEAKERAIAEAEQEAAQRKQLQHQIAEQAPAVAGFDRIANADGAMCVTDAAKTLQMQPHKLRDALLEMKWMYRRQGKGGYVAYQDKIHTGYLKHKVGNYKDPETGENKTNPQVVVTSKGLAQLSKLLGTSTRPAPGAGRSPLRLN